MLRHVNDALIVFASFAAACAAAELRVRPAEEWSSVFGGAPVTLHYRIEGPQEFRGRLGWSLSVAGRTLARREQAVAVNPGRPETVAVTFEFPKVKPGVIMEARLSVAVYGQEGAPPAASHEKMLWVFCDDPFAHQTEWVKQLGIVLFDPEEGTRKAFEKARIPFTAAGNLDAVAELSKGLLVVGEGTSFEDCPGLPDVMMKLAAKGVPVCCLAPSGGEFVLPGTEGAETPRPTRFALRRNDIITELDKRLDATSWPPDGKVVASSLAVRTRREVVVADAVAGDTAWPWLELSFPGDRAKLVVCGFGIVSHWEAGPAPRFLLARILEFLDGKENRK